MPRLNTNVDFGYTLPQDGIFVKKIGEKSQYDIGKPIDEFIDHDSQETNALGVDKKAVFKQYEQAVSEKGRNEKQLDYMKQRKAEFKAMVDNAIESVGEIENYATLKKKQAQLTKSIDAFILDTKKGLRERGAAAKLVEEQLKAVQEKKAAEPDNLTLKEIKERKEVDAALQPQETKKVAEIAQKQKQTAEKYRAEKAKEKFSQNTRKNKNGEVVAAFKPVTPKTSRERLKESYIITRIAATDSGAAVYEMDVDLFGKKDKTNHIYKYWDYSKRGRSSGESALYTGQVNAQGDTVGKSLTEIFKPIEKKGAEYSKNFADYMWHRLNTERYGRGKGVFGKNVTAKESKAIVEKYESSNAEFKKHAQEIYSFLKNNLQLRVDSGLIKAEFAAYLEDIYHNYVPLARKIEVEAEIPSTTMDLDNPKTIQMKSISQGIGIAQESALPLKNLKETISKHTLKAYSAAYRNMFANKLYDVVMANKDNPNIGKYVWEIRNLGKDGEHLDVKGVVFYRNGTKHQMAMSEIMYQAFEQYTQQHSALDSRGLVKAASHVNNTLKKLITGYNPLFIVRNFTKDMGDALIYTKNPFPVFIKNAGVAAKDMTMGRA